jgi:hypothetical protein
MKHFFRRIFSTSRSRPAGRPPGSGTWANGEDFEAAVLAAIEALEEKGHRPTQERVSRHLSCHERTLRYWIRDYGFTWTELVKRGRAISRKL